MPNLLLFLTISNSILILLIGIVVLLKSRNKINIIFTLLTFFLAAWVITLHLSNIHFDKDTALLWNRVVFACGISWVMLICNFVIEFPRLSKKYLSLRYFSLIG